MFNAKHLPIYTHTFLKRYLYAFCSALRCSFSNLEYSSGCFSIENKIIGVHTCFIVCVCLWTGSQGIPDVFLVGHGKYSLKVTILTVCLSYWQSLRGEKNSFLLRTDLAYIISRNHATSMCCFIFTVQVKLWKRLSSTSRQDLRHTRKHNAKCIPHT